ncbi:MAG: transcriptional regulator [Candidatus Nezhaarchaeota archaeon]|nr:transcriptional regulator [Candidatus Nezhaarchaeota archaeon]MCX8142386.1 transcriptional regulator [Candidatus Nezhaarchaeota archaeon]MDW8050641.1 transcriptional regulator [Nitrososphaerota archaeon]
MESNDLVMQPLSPSAYGVLWAALRSDKELADELRKVLEELRLSIERFSKVAGIPSSTLKKVLRAQGGITLSTLRRILSAISLVEGSPKTPFVAVIAALTTLSRVKMLSVKYQDTVIAVKGYGVSTIDEAIRAALRAQREGASVIVCAPIVAQFIKDLVSMPIVTVEVCDEDLERAIRIAAEKVTRSH